MYKRFGLGLIALFISGVAMALGSVDEKEYRELLIYEYNNRTFARLAMARAARAHAGSDRGEYFQAYYDLETSNQKIYDAMQTQLGLDHQPGCYTRFRGHFMGLLASWIKTDSAELDRVIVPYLEKLKRLQTLAPKEHKAFFAYVVEQEEIQLKASRATKTEDWLTGARLFREFIDTRQHSFMQALPTTPAQKLKSTAI